MDIEQNGRKKMQNKVELLDRMNMGAGRKKKEKEKRGSVVISRG